MFAQSYSLATAKNAVTVYLGLPCPGRSALYASSLILSEILGCKCFYSYFIETHSDLVKATQFINDRIKSRMTSKTHALSIYYLVFEGTIVSC